MEVGHSQIGPHYMVSVTGDIDLYNVSKLKSVLFDAMKENSKSLILDMKGIYYIDSSGIGTLVAVQKKMRSTGGNFALVNVRDDVMEIMRLASLHNYFTIHKTDLNLADVPIEKPIGSIEASKKKEPDSDTEEKKAAQEEKPASAQKEEEDEIVFKGWVNSNTFRMPADGFPKKSTSDELQRKIEAKNSAIRTAQILILEDFVNSIECRNWMEFHRYRKKVYAKFSHTVRKGVAKLSKFDSRQNCTIIYEVKETDLQKNVQNNEDLLKKIKSST